MNFEHVVLTRSERRLLRNLSKRSFKPITSKNQESACRLRHFGFGQDGFSVQVIDGQEFNYQAVGITHLGLDYLAYLRARRRRTFVNSVIIPILVSIATTALLNLSGALLQRIL